jgi:hypothetical protein
MKTVAQKTPKTYTVTISSAENAYDDQQLLKSIFESMYVASKDSSKGVSLPESEETQERRA